jgi:hypothetical protein
METHPLLRFLIAGELCRDFIITPGGKAYLDIPGGSLMYSTVGLAVWENGVGLLGRVGSDYPPQWMEELSRRGFDCRGIRSTPEKMDVRSFTAYAADGAVNRENPLRYFDQIGLPFPASLMGYNSKPAPLPPLYIRAADLPKDYLDAIAAHLCPLDFENHSLLLALLAQSGVSTITLDPHPDYMDAEYWDRIPALFRGVTAILVSETQFRPLGDGGNHCQFWRAGCGHPARGAGAVFV